MSEQFPGANPNQQHEVLALPDAAHAERLRPGEKDPLQAKAESEHLAAEAREVLAEAPRAEQVAAIQERFSGNEGASQAPKQTYVSKSLEKLGIDRELFTIRRRLNKPQRAASKVIHQPVVRVVSQVAGGSVSRPSGILGGGILAFLGTSSYLYLAKHYGFEYNAGVFVVLFLSGFILGLLAEVLVHFALNTRHHNKTQRA